MLEAQAMALSGFLEKNKSRVKEKSFMCAIVLEN